MKLIDRLTPKDTEEIKPGFFIQKRKGSWRRVEPMAWKGEWRTKEQLKSVFNFRTLFTIAIIIFLAWSYFNETEYCRELKKDPCELLPNITSYCFERQVNLQSEVINEEWKYPSTLPGNP